jgi:SPP1 family predicted phage head-tail adaptor
VTRSADGDVARTWVTLDRVSAFVRPLRGKELVEAARVGSEATREVKMQYYPGLKTSDRLRFDDGQETLTLQIESAVSPNERYRQHVLMCKEWK